MYSIEKDEATPVDLFLDSNVLYLYFILNIYFIRQNFWKTL